METLCGNQRKIKNEFLDELFFDFPRAPPVNLPPINLCIIRHATFFDFIPIQLDLLDQKVSNCRAYRNMR